MNKQVEQAIEEVLIFPNFFAWKTLNPVARAMVGATEEQFRVTYEAAFDVVLAKVKDADTKTQGAKT